MIELAERQFGVVARRQVRALGFGDGAVSRLVARGRLLRVYPGVYALGHRSLSTKGQLAAALLYAGPGAALSHAVAAWWWRLIPKRPRRLDISSPAKHNSLPDLRIHNPRHLERTRHRRLPITTPARTLLDVSPLLPFPDLRRALAEALFFRLTTPDLISGELTRGHQGSAALRAALKAHVPQLARSKSELENRFIELCERFGLPLPEVNVWVCGYEVDAVWRERKLIVEVDGGPAHSGPAAVSRDRARELALREAGWTIRRYSWQQVTCEPDRVALDLRDPLGLA